MLKHGRTVSVQGTTVPLSGKQRHNQKQIEEDTRACTQQDTGQGLALGTCISVVSPSELHHHQEQGWRARGLDGAEAARCS